MRSRLFAGCAVFLAVFNHAGFPRPAHGQVVELGVAARASGVDPGMPGLVAPAPVELGNLSNPAALGGISLSGQSLSLAGPVIGGGPAAQSRVAIGVSAPLLFSPVPEKSPAPGRAPGRKAPGTPVIVWGPEGPAPTMPEGAPDSRPKPRSPGDEKPRNSVGSLVEIGASAGDPARFAQVSGEVFDENRRMANDVGGVDEGNPPGGFNGSGGAGNGGPAGGDDQGGGEELNGRHPRVVMILDALAGPVAADSKLVKHVEALLDKGIKVVFVTARPDKGENSAESVLASKLKVRTGNPLMIVSYNGARVTMHNSKAEHPKPLIADQPPIADKTLAKFREIAAEVKARLGLRGELAEFGVPSLEAPFLYGAELPAGVDDSIFAREYNAALKSAGFKYKIELAEGTRGKKFFFTQSTALKLNTGRIFNALYALAPELDPAKGGKRALKPSEMLILADPAKAPSFLRSLPGRGYFIHGVSGAASLETALGAVLGTAAFEKIAVNKYELREYLDWLDRRERYGPGTKPGGGIRGGGRHPNSPANHQIAFYRGIVIKEVMSRLYHLMKNGAYEDSTLESAIELTTRLWRHPEANGLRLPEELKVARMTPGFQAAGRGGLDGATRWLKNYYRRNFPDFPRGVSEKVAGRLLRLAKDADSVELNYVAPFTQRRYAVWVRPDRTEIWDNPKGGYILVGHVYRTGREPYQKQFDESIEVNLVGRALLEGDAQKKADGRWYVNGEPDPQVLVVFHYNTRELEKPMSPAEVESYTPDVTALIEKRENDAEFKKWQEEKEKINERALAQSKRAATIAQKKKETEKAKRSGK